MTALVDDPAGITERMRGSIVYISNALSMNSTIGHLDNYLLY